MHAESIISALDDNGILYAHEGNHHCREGWVQVKTCPFCGSNNYHLGYNTDDNYFSCYRCGWHSVRDVCKELGIVLSRLQFANSESLEKKNNKDNIIDVNKTCTLPTGSGPIQERHKNYLKNINFDPEYIANEWGILGSGNLGFFKFRIIIPVYINTRLITFTARDITNLSDKRYINCKNEESILPIKHTIYGSDKAIFDSVLVVEGPTDVWRYGPGAVATFGIQYSQEQIELLKKYKRVVIAYDREKQAQIQAIKLAKQLVYSCQSVEVITPPANDVGEMKIEDIKKLHKFVELGNAY